MIVVWRVTQRCNLRCAFCAYDRRLAWPRRDADLTSIERFGAVLADYQRATGDSTLVSWIGGEPFLFPALHGLTSVFTRELGLRVSATTNGTSLSSAAVRADVLAHYTELTVSIDGIGSVHDELRGWPGGYATLRDAILQLAEAKRTQRQGPRLRANVVLMRDTIRDFERLCLELADWGLDEITFNQLGGRDRPEFFSAHRLLPADAQWIVSQFPRLRTRLAKLGVRLSGSEPYLSRISASTRDQALPVAHCHPGERFLFIDEQGIAAPCNYTTPEYGVPLNELKSAAAVCELPLRFAQARRARCAAACQDCHSTQVFAKFA